MSSTLVPSLFFGLVVIEIKQLSKYLLDIGP
jgi:hypothetical protein